MYLNDKIVEPRDKLLKKKNSEIENRLFGKTKYYVIAIGKRPISPFGKNRAIDDECLRVRAYIYYNGYICFYNTQGKAYNKREYINYIDFVKNAVQKNTYDWTNFWINKGQIITKDVRGNIIIDNELVEQYGEKSRVRVDISDLTLQSYVDAMKSVYKNDNEKIQNIEKSFYDGSLKKEVQNKVKNRGKSQLKLIDGEIIVRIKIEGYNYITSYVKSILSQNSIKAINILEDFFIRLFFLEMNGYIFDYRD